jgi:hypothetical protein
MESARSVSGSRPRIGPVLGLYRVVLLMGLLGVPHGLRCHRIAGNRHQEDASPQPKAAW